MKKRRFDEMRNGSADRDTKQKEVIQMIMRKDRGIRSRSYMIAIVVAVMGMSLILVQVAGAVNYTITVTQSANGTISPGTSSVLGGTDKAFTITPKAGYAIRTLTVDNVPIQPSRTYKFLRVSAVHSIKATFALDQDNDGIPDDVETQGITLYLDKAYQYPVCQNPTPEQRIGCVDPATKDVFVVLVPALAAQGGRFSALQNPLQYVTQSAGGLPIAVHWIVLPEGFQDVSNRFLSFNSAQKYVRITESLNIDDPTVLGSSTCGTPDQDLGTVYTQRIVNHVNSIYGNVDPQVIDNTINTYIKHTITHEFAHMVGPLAPVYKAAYGGYHYASDPNDQIMNQSVYVTGTGIDAVFYIGTSYTSADQAGVKLK
jgi:hypothetical protein